MKREGKVASWLLGDGLPLALSTGYSSVHASGGASDRRYLKARRTNGLTYLLTYLPSTAIVPAVSPPYLV